MQRAKSKSATHKCKEHDEEVKALFHLDVTSDEPDVHPKLFCNSCYAVLQRHSTAVSKGILYRHSIEVFSCEKHRDEECAVSIVLYSWDI